MSIASEITRINNNIANAYDECETKGATMPQYENSANLASTIASIPSGGGGADLSEYFNVTVSGPMTSANNLIRNGVKKYPPLIISEGVTSLYSAFSGCIFTNFIVPEIDLSNITNLSYFFSYSGAIQNVDLSNLKNTEGITNIEYMFYSCPNLIKIDLSVLKPTALSQAASAFSGCSKTAILDISNLSFNNLQYSTSRIYMFSNFGYHCLQSDGAYADGIPYVYVKDQEAQNWVLTDSYNGHPSTWTTDNVVIKSN